MLSRLPFAQKVTLLITLLITVSSVCITGVAAYQFRGEIYYAEYSSAFTVYMAAANYLTAHYETHHLSFYKKSLDFVLSRKFMRLNDEEGAQVTHRPARLAIYDEQGRKIYEYAENGVHAAPRYIPVRDLPKRYRQDYDKKSKTIQVSGLISADGDVPGYVYITFPSDLERKTGLLYRNMFAVMFIVILLAIGFSSLMAGRALRPVESLIRAAKRVRRGDLDQHVIVAGEDEIGLLAQTFNEMVGSLGRRIALMHRMQEWAMELNRIYDMNDLYDGLIDMCVALSSARNLALYIRHDRNAKPAMVAGHFADRSDKPDEALIERAGKEQRPRFIEQRGEEVFHPEHPVEMALPLIAGGEEIGVIWLGPPAHGGSYEDETVTMMETMAQYAASAIENITLYHELSEKERYEKEMALARQIQAGMLPKKVPGLSGYALYGICNPAFEVGGDYYDYVRAGEDRLQVVIADVSGKGVPAAMIVSIVRTLMHTCVQFDFSTAQLLRWVNRNLSPDLKTDMFVTLGLVTLHSTESSLSYLRAGHEPAILVRRDGAVERITPDGTALGLLDAGRFDELLTAKKFTMNENDTLLLYTDGLTEAVNADDEEFGCERLEQSAAAHRNKPPQEMVHLIIADVESFAADQPQHDDMTLIAIRRSVKN